MKKPYIPNFTDPRTIKRINKIFKFIDDDESIINPYSPVSQCNRTQLNPVFGKAELETSKYLRNIVLICKDYNYNYIPGKEGKGKGNCRKYIYNVIGIEYLKERINQTTDLSWDDYQLKYKFKTKELIFKREDKIFDKFKDELASGEFTLSEKADRLYHPIQTIPSTIRNKKLKEQGYNYNYDIQCCQPTLISQHAKHLDLNVSTPTIDLLLNDRTLVREQIAFECGIQVSQAKEIINALFNGAKITSYYKAAIPHILFHKHQLIENLKGNTLIRNLQKDIRLCWQTISPTMSRRYRTRLSDSKRVLIPINSKEKSDLYRSFEFEIIKLIKKYQSDNFNKTFPIHDGFVTQKLVDLPDLISLIRIKTGFKIKLDCSKL